jgi:hypothetical protein
VVFNCWNIPAGYHDGTGSVTANPNQNSTTYTYPANSTGGTVDMGVNNIYRYVNATNVYNKGKADGVTTHTGTYTLTENDFGTTKDMGVNHTYRYISVPSKPTANNIGHIAYFNGYACNSELQHLQLVAYGANRLYVGNMFWNNNGESRLARIVAISSSGVSTNIWGDWTGSGGTMLNNAWIPIPDGTWGIDFQYSCSGYTNFMLQNTYMTKV